MGNKFNKSNTSLSVVFGFSLNSFHSKASSIFYPVGMGLTVFRMASLSTSVFFNSSGETIRPKT